MDDAENTGALGGRPAQGMKRQLRRCMQVARTPATSEEIAAALAEVAEHTDLNADLTAAEGLARDVLRAAGLPENLGPFARLRDGSLRELPTGWREAGFGALGSDVAGVVTLDGALRGTEGTREYDAARILRLAESVRRALEDGRVLDAVWNGMRLGREALLLELDLKGWPAAAEVGDAVKLGGAKGGTSTRQRDPEQTAVRRRVEAEARQRLNDGWLLGKSALARHFAAKHGLRFNTVRDWLKPIPDPTRKSRKISGG
jgi:hypothetical protein